MREEARPSRQREDGFHFENMSHTSKYSIKLCVSTGNHKTYLELCYINADVSINPIQQMASGGSQQKTVKVQPHHGPNSQNGLRRHLNPKVRG